MGLGVMSLLYFSVWTLERFLFQVSLEGKTAGGIFRGENYFLCNKQTKKYYKLNITQKGIKPVLALNQSKKYTEPH